MSDTATPSPTNRPPDQRPEAFSPLIGEATVFRQRLLDSGFSQAHIVELRHVWVFDRLETFTRMITRCAPPAVAMFATMTEEQRSVFIEAVRDDFRGRQGGGPYAVTHEALIAVATNS